MLISSHCRWPWLRYFAGGREVGEQVHAVEDCVDCFALLGGFAAEQIAPHVAPAGQGELHVFVNGEAVEDGGRLEFSSDAQAGDFDVGHLRDVDAIEENLAARDAGLAADDIAERGLAGAVGADDDAQLVAIDAERADVERFEAVENDGDIFQRRRCCCSSRAASTEPGWARAVFHAFSGGWLRNSNCFVAPADFLARLR